jgi:DNA transformation protein
MSTQQSTVDFLMDQLRPLKKIMNRKMFGEYAIYYDTKVVALVCDDQLFVKPTEAGKTFLKEPEMGPPYPGAKMYFVISEDSWEDGEWLRQLIKMTGDELPLPKPKKPKKK